ncbi:uncharacterized protein METZ01_LOCUS335455, partial [marine metagenome]
MIFIPFGKIHIHSFNNISSPISERKFDA